MSVLVTSGTQLMCSFGAAPSVLQVLPTGKVLCGTPVANIMDSAPIVNVSPFGMCTSMANPMVSAATAAAMGVLTPQQCIPAIIGPWSPGSATVMVGGKPAVNNTCKLMCAYAGVIQVVVPAQMTTMVP